LKILSLSGTNGQQQLLKADKGITRFNMAVYNRQSQPVYHSNNKKKPERMGKQATYVFKELKNQRH
jgi:hypothetical protein